MFEKDKHGNFESSFQGVQITLKSEFLYNRLHQIVLKKNLLDLQQCKFERSPQSKLDRGCNEAKSVNFKSRAQTPLKEV